MNKISGVFAPIVTPFHRDGVTIDYAWIPYHLQYLQNNRLDGVIPIGTTGEGHGGQPPPAGKNDGGQPPPAGQRGNVRTWDGGTGPPVLCATAL